MDTLERYRRIVQEVLRQVAEERRDIPDREYEKVFDVTGDHYLVMAAGWEKNLRRIHFCLLHLDIINGKVWIQRDGTEAGIAYALEDAGIPKSDMVLAFHSESVRPHTGYAVA